MSYLERVKELKRGEIKPLYLLYGTESYLVEDITQRIIRNSLEQGEEEMNLIRLDMEETPVDLAVEEAYTFPFFGARKVVILKNAYFLTGQKRKEQVEHTVQKLADYAASPSEETVLIVQVPAEKPDERKKAVKLLRKHGAVLDASPLQESELQRWMTSRVEEEGASLGQGAAQRLLELAGTNLLVLSSELNKLAIRAGDGPIERRHVEELTARSLEQDIFALVDAVVKQDVTTAVRIYHDLLKQKESPLKITALMVRQFRILYQVKQLMQQGYGEKMIASRLKLHPYPVKLAARQARSFESSYLLRILDELAELDFRIKTGGVEEQFGVEWFLLSRNRREAGL
ncbi:DNA polymerase III subunit delta [Alkalicoccus urumqiensis]|uniref:DNA polymerase III subunit delta n=1 Tax=Alkalicoccus urumqiensis TaxID=1548213 RepID=A0A2P6MFP5_ALKUR|nr:DNA polymerase III subunit delta [Alkalicoccus urumqiensis]PRO65087.1 DNA polymerase III subunit delta [Alkalicoccus urumqiensis]